MAQLLDYVARCPGLTYDANSDVEEVEGLIGLLPIDPPYTDLVVTRDGMTNELVLNSNELSGARFPESGTLLAVVNSLVHATSRQLATQYRPL